MQQAKDIQAAQQGGQCASAVQDIQVAQQGKHCAQPAQQILTMGVNNYNPQTRVAARCNHQLIMLTTQWLPKKIVSVVTTLSATSSSAYSTVQSSSWTIGQVPETSTTSAVDNSGCLTVWSSPCPSGQRPEKAVGQRAELSQCPGTICKSSTLSCSLQPNSIQSYGGPE